VNANETLLTKKRPCEKFPASPYPTPRAAGIGIRGKLSYESFYENPHSTEGHLPIVREKGLCAPPERRNSPGALLGVHDGGRPPAARELLLSYMTGSGGMCWGLEKLGGGFLKVSGDAAVLCFCWVG
jgi:hypothetical protein